MPLLYLSLSLSLYPPKKSISFHSFHSFLHLTIRTRHPTKSQHARQSLNRGETPTRTHHDTNESGRDWNNNDAWS